MERGTLYQLRNLIDRRNVTTKVKSDVNAAEDFLETVVVGYIVAAVMTYLNMKSLNDFPDEDIVPPNTWMEEDSIRAATIENVSKYVVDNYVDLETVFKESDEVTEPGTSYDYTCEVISLGLLFLEFKDAIREGDGDRVLCVWKYLMLIWKATGHKNYSIEAFTMLAQYHLLLPMNLAEQLKWSRFINVHGKPGHNISCDLHMEHLNRIVKTAIEGLGANKSKKAITRAGRAVGSLSGCMNSFDKEIGVSKPSGKHSEKSRDRDLVKIIDELLLQNAQIFNKDTACQHKSFISVKKNIIKKLSEKKVKEWMIERLPTAFLEL